MSAFETARAFVTDLEAFKGWEVCKQYVEEGAVFSCQAPVMEGVNTVQQYCEWVVAFGTVTAPGATYETHAFAWDEARRVAVFVATYHAKHTGEGGPVPATNRETHSEYVYTLFMNENDKVERILKVWNDLHALKELGWT